MSPPKLDVDDWNCPVCMEVLHKPAANVCGHVFCFWCLHHAMSPFTPSKCPLCRSAYANLPSVCLVLHQFLLKAFPTEYKQRLADVAADEEQQEISSPEVRVNEPGGSTSQDGQATFHEEEFLCSRPGCGRLLHNPVVLTCGHTIVVRQTTVCHQLSHLLQSLFPEAQQHRAQESSVRFRGLRALAQLTRDANTHFTHHGVGCDSCGVYPIVGRRYRCMDCQEKMGTDLCGPCMDRGLHVTGRFNQQHKPDHQMMLIKPRINELHILQAMNPELSMDSLMYLLEMTVEPEQDAPAEGAASGEDDDYVPGTHWDGTVPGLDGDDQNWAALAAGVRASRDGSGSGQGNGSPSTGTQEGPGATGMAGGGSGSGHGDDNGGRPSDNAEEGGDAGAGGAAIAGWDGSRPGGGQSGRRLRTRAQDAVPLRDRSMLQRCMHTLPRSSHGLRLSCVNSGLSGRAP
ncbi:hypothetical protein WJX72_008568 [[Myrmecia] bisecta]|uniref:E3 ubiquitin-protein ligase PRT1 n=1 Tax=[Myrmecia] bisecta TaxID=41462 RepID=A0AAW1QST7_9CHLO